MPPKLQIKPKVPPRGRRGGAGSGAESTPADGSTPAADTAASTPAAAPPPPLSTVATTRSIAPPVGRLDSLKTPSIGPGSPAGGSLSASATPPPGALRGKAPLRFKPKAVVRKTAEERAKLEATVASASATPGPSGEGEAGRGALGRGGFSGHGSRGGVSGEFRGRGRGGRGRGRGRGGMNAGYQAVASTASGPFSLGSITSGRSKVVHERGNDVRTSSGKSKSKSKGIYSLDADGVKIKSEGGDDPDYYSPTDEESDGGPKVNVERIVDLIDSDEEGDEATERGEKAPVMFPLRVERIKHEERERAVPIFKDPDTSKKSKGGRKVKLEEGEVQVKAEPIDDGDIALVDAPPITDLDAEPRPPSSPEVSKKNLNKPSQSPELKRKDRRKSSGTGRRRRPSQILSPEEEMEVKMEEEDRLATLRELGTSLPSSGQDEAEDNAAGELEAIKSGDLFFFQFPTILPPLEPIQQIPAQEDSSAPIDLDSTAGIKTEPGTQRKRVDKAADKIARLRTAYNERTPLPQGMVGQLRIHKSGKVSILWGNSDSLPHEATPSTTTPTATTIATTTTTTSAPQPIEMLVTRGAYCEFLQDVVVMNPHPKEEEQDKDLKEKDVSENGKALEVVNAGLVDSKTGKKKGGIWSLGQVRGKFVVSPDFEKLVVGGGR